MLIGLGKGGAAGKGRTIHPVFGAKHLEIIVASQIFALMWQEVEKGPQRRIPGADMAQQPHRIGMFAHCPGDADRGIACLGIRNICAAHQQLYHRGICCGHCTKHCIYRLQLAKGTRRAPLRIADDAVGLTRLRGSQRNARGPHRGGIGKDLV